MSDSVETIIRETSEQLRKHLNPEAIWFFGSHARGDAGPDSNLDFLVLVGDSPEPRYRRAGLAPVTTPRDVLVLTRVEWERDCRVPVSLANTVLHEGKQIFER